MRAFRTHPTSGLEVSCGYGLLTGEADVLVEAFAELAVHMEEIAGTHDLVLMDAHRRAVLLGPGLGPDRAGDDPFAPPGLVAEGAGGGGGIVYECRFAVEVDLFGGFLCGAEVGGEGEGDGGNDPGDEAEVGDDGDDGISAVATGDFLDRHGGSGGRRGRLERLPEKQ